MGKLKKVLVTGADGFIGKNLLTRLNETGNYETIKFLRGDNLQALNKLVLRCDIIIHLAGENRPNDLNDYEKTNVGLTSHLCNAITQKFLKFGQVTKLIFASSTQVNLQKPYGKSKKSAENLIINMTKDYGISACIYRFPGVFGKWCRPNYNSVVATFCNNISRGLPIRINDSEISLTLIYIDDLVDTIIKELQFIKPGIKWGKVNPEYSIKLGELAKIIKTFNDCQETSIIGAVGSGLERALYATFVSYLPINKFTYELDQHGDERGVFVEVLKTQDCGQFSFFTAYPGVTRGGHYHHTKSEKFLVIKGSAVFKFRNILNDKIVKIEANDQKSLIVETIPGWAHDITNVGDKELVVMLWANEKFDTKKPDTIITKV